MKIRILTLTILLSALNAMGADLVVENGSTNTFSNISTNFSGNAYIGSNTVDNLLIITNSATVENSFGVVGLTSNASNNSVKVTGAGSVWTNREDLYVGYGGMSNSILIEAGGTLVSSNGFVGRDLVASGNAITVTGAGSAWTNRTDLFIGYYGEGSSLRIEAGGFVESKNTTLVLCHN